MYSIDEQIEFVEKQIDKLQSTVLSIQENSDAGNVNLNDIPNEIDLYRAVLNTLRCQK